jgi:2-amino-4-hydroxy-6-hydroxymethyldihydropteridine diphosphokinase
MTHTVYLGLGSNLGNREENLRGALFEIASSVGVVEAVSSFIVTEPWGFESTHTFVNAVCRVQTRLSPMEVLDATQAIERNLGRTKKSVDGVYSDRLIDIDILLYDDWKVDTPRLVIPHPLMAQRDFVKIPLAELGVII